MRFVPYWISAAFVAGALAQPPQSSGVEVGSKVCAGCHREIYRKYSATGMAQSSGSAGKGVIGESFDQPAFSDPAVGAEYHISKAADAYRLEFSRADSGVRGERLLRWFVGSGRVGRSYLFAVDGFLFQSPLSYYSLSRKWDISPGYRQHRSIHLTRAIGAGCLQCHASRLQPVAGTQNGFQATPFLEAGIGCERCHGAGKSHVARMTSGNTKGTGDIVNPAKLEPARRDSICAQCHLTGAARIARRRAAGAEYRPGDLLPDYSAFFVWTVADSTIMSANSHFEKLQQSACKRASGDRLWCGSCHDPHVVPEPASLVNFYRARCQKCHRDSACKEKLEARRKAQDDCIGCHMPKAQVRDTEHAVFTDHSIPRRIPRPSSPETGGRSLTSFWKSPVDDRDLGLAFAAVADKDPSLRRRAFELLRKAEARDPDDVLALVQLAQLYDQAGDDEQAMALSERALRLDPAQVTVMVNLGAYYMQRGRGADAMRLWAEALARAPGLTAARVNLGVAQYRAGDPAAAEATVVKALEYDPDDETARRLLSEIRGSH